MQHRQLRRTGVSVSKLCLGTMMFGAWGNRDHDDSTRIIHAALDAGINFIDTADVYSAGESEQIVGKALGGGRRDDVILATKVHMAIGKDPNQRGNTRRWILREVEDWHGASHPRPRGRRAPRRRADRCASRPATVRLDRWPAVTA
jgi:aryl-alcohol dehydrogenase-like predicted oxidoreductase